MLELALTIVLFLTVVLAVFSFGAAVYAPSSVIGSRLRSLAGGPKVGEPPKPAIQGTPRAGAGSAQQSLAVVRG